jgi:hypothetical protein
MFIVSSDTGLTFLHMTLGLLAADVCLLFAVLLSMCNRPKKTQLYKGEKRPW